MNDEYICSTDPIGLVSTKYGLRTSIIASRSLLVFFSFFFILKPYKIQRMYFNKVSKRSYLLFEVRRERGRESENKKKWNFSGFDSTHFWRVKVLRNENQSYENEQNIGFLPKISLTKQENLTKMKANIK